MSRSKFTQSRLQHDLPRQPDVVTLQRQWRPRPDPIDGLRPMSFHSDHDELHVHTVNIFPISGGIAINFQVTPGSINVVVPGSMVRSLGNGLVRLASQCEGK
jgi:hypothetical protein